MRNLILAATLGLASLASPSFADSPSTPPGNPCLKNNGNPCNGNNGNLGQQGNAGHEWVKIDKKPPPITISMPAVQDRGVFISQVGDSNNADVAQTAPNAYASVNQNGNSNEANLAQLGSATGYIAATQTGDGNFARIGQSGTGQNVAYVAQNGVGNWLWSNQQALGSTYNGARLTQSGNNNDMSLSQDGSDNLAVLTQTGDDNGMTATQLGTGNRLTWIQNGNNLSDLKITQTGGFTPTGQMLITQTSVPPGH